MAWHLIRTISGKEFEVAAELSALGFEIEHPTCIRLRRQKAFRRHKETVEAVLPCYVFSDIPDEAHGSVKGIKHIIADGVVCLHRQDMKDLREFVRLASRGYFDHSGIYGHLEPGQIMRVIGGIFADLQFSFEEVKGDRIKGNMGGRKVEFDALDVDIAS